MTPATHGLPAAWPPKATDLTHTAATGSGWGLCCSSPVAAAWPACAKSGRMATQWACQRRRRDPAARSASLSCQPTCCTRACTAVVFGCDGVPRSGRAQGVVCTQARRRRRLVPCATYPTGRGRVGMSSVSLPNIAESASNPLARLMSETCTWEDGQGSVTGPRARHVRRWISMRTVTLYRTAKPASVSILVSCGRRSAENAAVSLALPPEGGRRTAAQPHLVADEVLAQGVAAGLLSSSAARCRRAGQLVCGFRRPHGDVLSSRRAGAAQRLPRDGQYLAGSVGAIGGQRGSLKASG